MGLANNGCKHPYSGWTSESLQGNQFAVKPKSDNQKGTENERQETKGCIDGVLYYNLDRILDLDIAGHSV
jgi:hypothetical protein